MRGLILSLIFSYEHYLFGHDDRENCKDFWVTGSRIHCNHQQWKTPKCKMYSGLQQTQEIIFFIKYLKNYILYL